MSVQWISWVLDETSVKGADRLVLISLANHADGSGQCYPGRALIAQEAQVHEKSVQQSIRRLIAAGLLERVVNGAPMEMLRTDRSDRRPNLYRLVKQRGERETPPSAERGERETPNGVSESLTRTVSEPSVSSSSEEETRVTPLRFASDAQRLAELLVEGMVAMKPDRKRPTITRAWLEEIDRMLRIDKRNPERVERMIRWLFNPNPPPSEPLGWRDIRAFWWPNIQSPKKLRKHYDTIAARVQAANANGRSGSPYAIYDQPRSYA